MSYTVGNIAYEGLDADQVVESRNQWGANLVSARSENEGLRVILTVLQEPMIILLLVAAIIYFFYGQLADGILLTVAIFLVAAIALFQNQRSRKAIDKLRDLSQPLCKVIRSGQLIEVNSESIVVGDVVMVDEESVVVADGIILHANDFTVNESILTGESLPVAKNQHSNDPKVYKGTIVATGTAVIRISAIGIGTRLGQIGKSMDAIEVDKSPMQIQLESFVKRMIVIGLIVFIIVLILNFLRTRVFVNGLLESLALAMSILPEEIPVALATFTAMGAWRLSKKGIIVKDMNTIEALGKTSVICVDKTGTITQNKMTLAGIYIFATNSHVLAQEEDIKSKHSLDLLSTAMWASEPIPIESMEKALHNAYETNTIEDKRPDYEFINEYPLGGHPPMMTHIFRNQAGHQVIAAKGALEAIMNVSVLNQEQIEQINRANSEFEVAGYRILGVAASNEEFDEFPKNQQDIPFQFLGLVAFHDAPKPNIGEVLGQFYNAGIQVKMITGDTMATASHVAKVVDFRGYDKAVTGAEIMELDDSDFDQSVRHHDMFCRMFPEAKLRVVECLKTHGNIVSMVGDGVNDGPALKAANIGIAMGQKGTEIAKQAASIVLTDDNLSRLVYAIAMGRKIYANLKKAIRYIISIHIPIILIVFIPLALGWIYPHIFTPVHVIFLELVMGPTCSIIYENEPIEPDLMSKDRGKATTELFTWPELLVSISQGLVITLALLILYQYCVHDGLSETKTRSVIFLSLIVANIALTYVNRSFAASIFSTIRYKNSLITLITCITVALTGLIFGTHFGRELFHLNTLNISQLSVSIVAGALSVLWFEGYKFFNRGFLK